MTTCISCKHREVVSVDTLKCPILGIRGSREFFAKSSCPAYAVAVIERNFDKLEVGKFYLRRDGGIVPITYHDPVGCRFEFGTAPDGDEYRDDGRCMKYGEDHPNDLIAVLDGQPLFKLAQQKPSQA
jgi:hypothetical protein